MIIPDKLLNCVTVSLKEKISVRRCSIKNGFSDIDGLVFENSDCACLLLFCASPRFFDFGLIKSFIFFSDFPLNAVRSIVAMPILLSEKYRIDYPYGINERDERFALYVAECINHLLYKE
jgi:hypothetical protein